MKLPSWISISGRPEERAFGHGPLTGCDLSQLAPLTGPFARDAFQRLRPSFGPEAAQLSLELASMAYTLDVEPWQQAGWRDFSILIDDTLHTGLSGWDGGLKLLMAKASLKDYSPVSQLLGALRQKEKSDTVKAVCTMHPLENGRWLLAIGFMGTGRRLYDWISNLRFTPEEGFHRGFLQLCESFEGYAESIVFPEAARELGLERLSLGDVLSDLRSLKSPFRLWMAGHSQGGAVMQVFTHRLITDWGVAPQNLVGYGFASPTVATGRFVYDPAAYPLYHLINSDDFVPRMGALVHLGLCLSFPADADFASATYRQPADPELYAQLAPLAAQLTDTPSCLLFLSALLDCLAEEKGAGALNELLNGWWSVPAMDRALFRAGDRAVDLINQLLGSVQEAYTALTGQAMNPGALDRLHAALSPIVRENGVRALLTTLGDYAGPPHQLDRAYALIVRSGLNRLRPFIWQKEPGSLPTRRWAPSLSPALAPVLPSASRARRGQPHRPEIRGKLRLSYHARKD